MESKHPANYPVKHTAVRVLALLNILCNILLACIVIYLLRDRKNEELAQYFDASTTVGSLDLAKKVGFFYLKKCPLFVCRFEALPLAWWES